MDYQPKEITILKNDEFMLMLIAAGINEWYGIDLNDEEYDLGDERSFNESLAALYQKHIVSWGEQKAHIEERYRPLLTILKEASSCVTASSVFRPGYIRGCYFGKGNVVTIERRTASNDELELSLLSFQEWISELEEEGWWPQTMPFSPNEHDIEAAGETLVSEFDLRSVPGGELMQALRLYEQGLYGIIELGNDNGKTREPFTVEKIAEVLNNWAGGNE